MAYAPLVSRNRLSSVSNAARVLKAFSVGHPTWGVAELAGHLDLSTSTTHRLLSTLTDHRHPRSCSSSRARLTRRPPTTSNFPDSTVLPP